MKTSNQRSILFLPRRSSCTPNFLVLTNLNKFVLHLNVKRLEVSHSLTVEWELYIVGEGYIFCIFYYVKGRQRQNGVK